MPEEEFREFLREEIEKLRQFAESIDDAELNRQLARDDEELIDEEIREHRALPTDSDGEIPCLNHFIIDPTHPHYAYQFRESK